MMGLQDAIVAVIVLGAVAWLVRRQLAKRRPTPLCGDCPGCDPHAHAHAQAAPGARRREGWVPASELRFPDA